MFFKNGSEKALVPRIIKEQNQKANESTSKQCNISSNVIEVHEKMFSITRYQGKANQNHKDTTTQPPEW